MTEEDKKHAHKQMVLMDAMREELAEMVQRYCTAKLDPDMVASLLYLASQKIMHATFEARLGARNLINSPLIEHLLNKLKEHVKSEAKDDPDKEDKE